MTFPRSHSRGPSSGVPPPSPPLPLLLGSLAPAVSCSEVSGYFYSGARGWQAAEPCRLEGSRTPAFAGEGRLLAGTEACPRAGGLFSLAGPPALGSLVFRNFFFFP